MSDAILVALCDAKIRGGDLPSTIRVTTLGAYSDGTTCAACGRPITRSSAEIALQWQNGAGSAMATIHPICFAAWTEAVRRVESRSEPS